MVYYVTVTSTINISVCLFVIGSCADLMHSAKQFNTGFQESVIAIILRDIVRGLHYIHSLGYVHR